MFVWKQKNGTIECIPEQQAVRLIAVFSLSGGFFGSVLDTIAGSVLFQVLLAAAQQRLIFSVCRFLSGTLWEHLWLTEVERLSKFVTHCRSHTSNFFYFIFGSLHLDTVLHGMMLMMLKSCQYYYGYYGYFFPHMDGTNPLRCIKSFAFNQVFVEVLFSGLNAANWSKGVCWVMAWLEEAAL